MVCKFHVYHTPDTDLQILCRLQLTDKEACCIDTVPAGFEAFCWAALRYAMLSVGHHLCFSITDCSPSAA